MFGFGKKDKAPPINKVDLIKQRVDLVKKITTAKGIGEQKARVALVLDYSGSMDSLYQNGTVQQVVERLLPVGVTFDDNQAIDLFIFHNKAYDLGEISPAHFDNVVKREIMDKYGMGGTSYTPIIEMIQEKYTSEKGDPAYVMFLADGDCSDSFHAERAITNAANHGIFFQFIGIGRASFGFLEKLDNMSGRRVDNANFFKVVDINKMTDDDLYNKMMDEFPDWLREAKILNII